MTPIDEHKNDVQVDIELRQERQKIKLERTAYTFNEYDEYYREQNAEHGELLEEFPIFIHRLDNEPDHYPDKKNNVGFLPPFKVIEFVQYVKEYRQAH